MSRDNSPPEGKPHHGCRWGLYVILDAGLAGRSHTELAQQAIKGGARVIQLRDKRATFEELVEVGHELRRITLEANVTFIINDNPYLAHEVKADGVHLGQMDCAVDIAREVMGPGKLVGLSTHTKQQAIAAQMLGVDYIGLGPIYDTTTKKSEWATLGLGPLRWVRNISRVPIVAIGGITEERLPDVAGAGADNVAIIGDLMRAQDIASRARHLSEIFHRSRKKGTES
ncbi:MAG: thiamine phosphate synthase [Candidatus Sumerlaeaceae bacterium]|nr:thiamine phosphate synthase [Candidatus Sumerlaeaceae bacterium]